MKLDDTRVLTKKITESSNKSCENICNLQKISKINGTCLSHLKHRSPVNYKNIDCDAPVSTGNICYCIAKPINWENITQYTNN